MISVERGREERGEKRKMRKESITSRKDETRRGNTKQEVAIVVFYFINIENTGIEFNIRDFDYISIRIKLKLS